MPLSSSLPLRALFLPLSLAACGDPAPTAITVETDEPPALVAFREDGSTAWRTAPVDAKHTFSFEATGPYHVVVACENREGLVHVAQYARTLDDAAALSHSCDSADDPFMVRGTVVQSGEVGLGNSSMAGEGPDWPFELPAGAGAVELVMRSSHEIAIRRDLQVAADMQLGSIDLAQVGLAALVPTTFTAANAGAAEIRSSLVLLDTGATVTFLSLGAGWSRDLAPESVLRPGDEQLVLLSASEPPSAATPQRRSRSTTRALRVGGPTEIALPAPLSGVQLESTAEKLSATWGELPTHDAVVISRNAYAAAGPESWAHELSLSRSFLEATGASSATLDFSGVPGFKAAWRPAAGLEETRRITALRGAVDGEREQSSVSEIVGPEVEPALASPASVARRLRAELRLAR